MWIGRSENQSGNQDEAFCASTVVCRSSYCPRDLMVPNNTSVKNNRGSTSDSKKRSWMQSLKRQILMMTINWTQVKREISRPQLSSVTLIRKYANIVDCAKYTKNSEMFATKDFDRRQDAPLAVSNLKKATKETSEKDKSVDKKSVSPEERWVHMLG
eukprot:Seg3848.2 transcript_id=Seg3848.2/GoldUCD/mRNA.D3Y31 product="hypothetical protein" protein_id=Seg3848.2/GoldUCD/D3Y31